jgi:hypothetical protein
VADSEVLPAIAIRGIEVAVGAVSPSLLTRRPPSGRPHPRGLLGSLRLQRVMESVRTGLDIGDGLWTRRSRTARGGRTSQCPLGGCRRNPFPPHPVRAAKPGGPPGRDGPPTPRTAPRAQARGSPPTAFGRGRSVAERGAGDLGDGGAALPPSPRNAIPSPCRTPRETGTSHEQGEALRSPALRCAQRGASVATGCSARVGVGVRCDRPFLRTQLEAFVAWSGRREAVGLAR